MAISDTKDSLDNPLQFLNNSDVKDHFANLNIELLKGRHIQEDEFYIFKILDKYEEELKYYYLHFYNLELERISFNTISYFYLTFVGDSKGVLSSQKRHKELSAIETITAITILNMYYEKLFEREKEVTYVDIKEKIETSEHSDAFKSAFFKGMIKDHYTSTEWINVFKNLKNVISDFDQLGWVEKIPIDDEKNFKFKIKESIHRFQILYENEIKNYNEFVSNYLLQYND